VNPPERRPAPAGRWLLGVLLVGGIYLGFYLTRMWYPHDEGALGQMAERVLQGEVPHRDFDEPYTGLLTYLHAGAFLVGGIRLSVLRIPLFVATLFWLAAVFAIARRSTGPPAAAGIALLALLWSVPNYPASMPSWYNLFCATFGVLALIRWGETGATKWLVLAGVAGGVSFLFKLSGLFYVAGALLFLVFATRRDEPAPAVPDRAGGPAAIAISLLLTVFVLLLWRSIAPYYQARTIVHFVLPGAAIAIALAVREWTGPGEAGAVRFRALLGTGVPFLAGVTLPVLVFLGGFLLAGGLGAFVNGVFVAPFRRLAFANMRPPAPYWALAAAPLVILLRPRPDAGNRKWRRMAMLVGVLLGFVLMLAYTDSYPHRFIWQSLRSLAPILALIAAAVIAWSSLAAAWVPSARRTFILLTSVSALASLIQFPFSSPTYFLYVAPLLLLSGVALIQGIGRTPAPLAAVTAAFYAIFAAVLVTPGALIGLGYRYEAAHQTVPLDLPRAGLRVGPDDAALYRELIPRVQARAQGGEIWAGPDAPEIYFLAGFRNRTRAIFDFLGDSGEWLAALQREIARPEVRAVVINTAPRFSGPLPVPLLEVLRQRFPEGETVGHFELRWRR
jgi:hypothetical protein